MRQTVWDDPSELGWRLEQAREVRAYYKDAAEKVVGILQYLS